MTTVSVASNVDMVVVNYSVGSCTGRTTTDGPVYLIWSVDGNIHRDVKLDRVGDKQGEVGPSPMNNLTVITGCTQ